LSTAKLTDVSEELTASIFVACIDLDEKTTRFSETAAIMYQSTLRHMPEELNLYRHGCKNFRFCIVSSCVFL
jgi:hypothetical protein